VVVSTTCFSSDVDLDVAITVTTSAAYRSLARRLRTYESATAETIYGRFIATRGELHFDGRGAVVRLVTHAYTPILRSAESCRGSKCRGGSGWRIFFELD